MISPADLNYRFPSSNMRSSTSRLEFEMHATGFVFDGYSTAEHRITENKAGRFY
jgi:hypothetical protein